MSDHRRYRRKPSSVRSSSGSRWSNSRSSMRASTTEIDDDVHGGHQRLKRPSNSLPVRRGSAASSNSWVLLNRTGARLDGVSGNRTTSTISRTSKGEEFSVSFVLAEPPGTSVLTFNRQPRPSTTLRKFSGEVVAAHRDVVLLAMTSYDYEDMYRSNSVTDLFVYQGSLGASGRRRPSLLLLHSAGGPTIYSHLFSEGEIGIMSCTRNNDDVDDSSSFIVALLRKWRRKGMDVHLFRPESGQWESFENLHVHGANGGRDLQWWSTDAVVPYGRRNMMIWADYYRGMVLMDLLSRSQTTTNPLSPPRLRYVPLPVDTVGDPEDFGFGRGSPKHSRTVCITRYGIKFVSVDSQHWSNFGVGHQNVLKWNHRFRITTWSLREDDEYTWRKDTTMHEEEFWDAIDGGAHNLGFPHVQPLFPVMDPENPDVVVFRLQKAYNDRNGTKWMIKVNLRKKVLLAATAYSINESDGLSGDAETINSVRVKSGGDPIPSEFPRYMDDGQAYKKRRQ